MTEEEYQERRRQLLVEEDDEGLRALERDYRRAQLRAEAPPPAEAPIPLRRVILQIAAWGAPAYQLPDGRLIYSPGPGRIRADTLARIQLDYPHAVIRDVDPEATPDGD